MIQTDATDLTHGEYQVGIRMVDGCTNPGLKSPLHAAFVCLNLPEKLYHHLSKTSALSHVHLEMTPF